MIPERRLLDLAGLRGHLKGLRTSAYSIKRRIGHKRKSALHGGKAVNSQQNVVKKVCFQVALTNLPIEGSFGADVFLKCFLGEVVEASGNSALKTRSGNAPPAVRPV